MSCVEAEKTEIFARGRHEAAVHPLALQPQHHDDIGVREPALHVVKGLDAHPLDAGRHQSEGADDAHPRAERRKQDDVRARDAGMQDVAADRDRQPLDAALVAADGQRVEQRLGRMLMRAVAGVDDRAIDLRASRCTAPAWGWRTTMMSGCMALSVIGGVDQRFALLQLEVCTDMLMTSAPSRLPASSKEDCVRVEI